jgi:ribonuclease HI
MSAQEKTGKGKSARLFPEPASQRGPDAGSLVIANVDGGARGNPGPAAYGIILRTADGNTMLAAGKCLGRTTNNVAEYYGLIAALDAATERGVRRLRVESDSELLVRQMQGEYRVKSPDLRPLHERAERLARGFEHFEITHVPREKNREADRLVNAALDGEKIEIRTAKIENRLERPRDRVVRAQYAGGAFQPATPVDLAEGTEVLLTIRPVSGKTE